MPKYKFWYKRIIRAKDIRQAILQEKKHELLFHSLEEIQENKSQKADAIGFCVTDEIDE